MTSTLLTKHHIKKEYQRVKGAVSTTLYLQLLYAAPSQVRHFYVFILISWWSNKPQNIVANASAALMWFVLWKTTCSVSALLLSFCGRLHFASARLTPPSRCQSNARGASGLQGCTEEHGVQPTDASYVAAWTVGQFVSRRSAFSREILPHGVYRDWRKTTAERAVWEVGHYAAIGQICFGGSRMSSSH